MERSNSASSNPLHGGTKPGSTAGPFAYQTRLLERGTSLSRSNSQGKGIFPNLSSTPTGTRKWTPSHRVGNSLDTVRGKWEERSKSLNDETQSPSSPSKDSSPWSSIADTPQTSPLRSTTDNRPLTPTNAGESSGIHRTPTYLKRHTLPAPIIASALSPNNTGITVEADSPPSPMTASISHRIHLPSTSFSHPSSTLSSSSKRNDITASSQPESPRISSFASRYRSHTLDSVPSDTTGSSTTSSNTPSASNPLWARTPSASSAPVVPPPVRPLSRSGRSFPVPLHHLPSHSLSSVASSSTSLPSEETLTLPPLSASSVMSPTPYRSSYMSKKKSSTYGDNLIIGRKLGRHLPRIASGDGDDDVQVEKTSEKSINRRDARERRARMWDEHEKGSPTEAEITSPTSANDVTGIPGRLRLSRNKAPSTSASPLPSSRLTRGLWADTQRHLLQAYEYLCHVGEAQQWIEGCLGEELEFGVVEMEDGLRNGVVLAKLVRTFQGPSAIRKIYEAPKLDFRHSDNINYFFNFVREIGLPEGFIFELTDLYEKKNLPKVIYCIHALSHLLARRGMAERIGNLLGHLKFSDDQLRKTQKGLKDAGVAMPNFGNVGRELAKEINEEPEVEVETEDELRDRLLLENETSIIGFQSLARAFLVRRNYATIRVRIRLTERHIPKLQARLRGFLARRRLDLQRQAQLRMSLWVVLLQSAGRAFVIRSRWYSRLRQIRNSVDCIVKIQAQARGILYRRRYSQLKSALRASNISFTRLQSVARARFARNTHRQVAKSFANRKVNISIVGVQSLARGVLQRRRLLRQKHQLARFRSTFTALQAHCRGVLMRRRMRTQIAKLEDVSHVVVRVQAAVRTYLARKRLLALIRGLRKATPLLVGLQAHARASLARQHHQNVHKALSEIKIVSAVGSLQALARASLARNRQREMVRSLEFIEPDVVGFQAVARSVFARREYCAWRDHLRRSQPVATILQAMLRGALQRRNFRQKMQYYRANLGKVVKIQSLFRAKETREQYRQLTLGTNVTVGTIKNFVHLLDDSEYDFQEEIKVERLRKKVVESIRENQALESEVSDLDVMISLVVHNVMSFEEVLKTRRRLGADSTNAYASGASLLAAHGDPFAGPSTLDHAAKRKRELYQQLFYLLQTQGEYLSRLFVCMSADNTPEKNRRLTERVVLTLFGYGQDRREDYLLLKLFQLSISKEIASSSSIVDIIHGHPMYINVAVQYIRPKQLAYAREALQTIIREVLDSNDLDLEVDPTIIHRSRINVEEMQSGISSTKPKDVPFYQALSDPDTRAEYIRHLQVLQWWTEAFVTAITQSVKKMPYNMRYFARETLVHLREKYPNASEELYAACIGRLVYYRYINPAIVTPETFDIVSTTVDVASRKNLAQISKILTQITSGSEFGDDNPSYVPINDYVRKAISQITAWFIEVADIPDAESHFHAHEFLDAIVQPKPIYISPNEIYAMHTLLVQNQDQLTKSSDDILRVILNELDGVPNLGSDELKDARDKAITLELTNRFAHVRDPHAEEKALWVQAKRGVLAILRVQPAQDLVESLMHPVTDDDELLWEDILENEMEDEQTRHVSRRQPSATGIESAYRLEDIRSLTFKEVKAHAIDFLLQLEKQKKITRADGFQGILNAIAGDVRSKHRKRLLRQQEMESMNGALRHLAERKKYFMEQINSYQRYIDSSMDTMQRGKGKKRYVIPFTKQYYHLRGLQKAGESPQFGSFIYTAKYLYEKRILLSIDQYSPRQFDKVQLTISSNTAGVFSLLLESTLSGVTTPVATQEIRMGELLQAKFNNSPSISLFSGMVKMNLLLFLAQINKKFYV